MISIIILNCYLSVDFHIYKCCLVIILVNSDVSLQGVSIIPGLVENFSEMKTQKSEFLNFAVFEPGLGPNKYQFWFNQQWEELFSKRNSYIWFFICNPFEFLFLICLKISSRSIIIIVSISWPWRICRIITKWWCHEIK